MPHHQMQQLLKVKITSRPVIFCCSVLEKLCCTFLQDAVAKLTLYVWMQRSSSQMSFPRGAIDSNTLFLQGPNHSTSLAWDLKAWGRKTKGRIKWEREKRLRQLCVCKCLRGWELCECNFPWESKWYGFVLDYTGKRTVLRKHASILYFKHVKWQ